jgi:RNA polymerase sigma factor FliA
MTNQVKRYKQNTTEIDGRLRDQLIIDYAPLVRFLAQRIAARLPANIDVNDLISAGIIGLMDAISKYDANRDNKFKTYAEFRIRGAILDELRSQDWVPRSVRDKGKKIDRVAALLEQKFGRRATDLEVADALGFDIESFYKLLGKVRPSSLVSLSDQGAGNDKDLLAAIENDDSKNPYSQSFCLPSLSVV